MSWFINEEGEVYEYDAATQEAEFPNDDHTPFETEEEALEAATAWLESLSPRDRDATVVAGLLADAEVDVENLPRDPTTGEWAVIPMTNARVELVVNVVNVTDLADALDVACVNIMRAGIDAYHVLVTDQDTGERWVVHNGEVARAQELLDAEAHGV